MSDPDQSQLEQKLRDIPEPLKLLVGLLAHSPVAYQLYRADGRCVLTNRAFLDLFKSEPPPEYNVLEDDVAAARGVLELIRSAFTGKTIHVPTVWYDPRELKQLPVTEGRRIAISSTFFPLFDAAGKVTHVGIAYKDETRERLALEEAERGRLRAVAAQRRASFLAAASTALSDTQDLDTTLREIARLSAEAIADWCVVTVARPNGKIERVAVVHRDPAKKALAEQYLRDFPPSAHRSPELVQVVTERRALLKEHIDAGGLASIAQDEDHRGVLEKLGVRSAILVPVLRGDVPLGVLTLVAGGADRSFTQEDLATAQDLAARIGLALENARLFDETRRAEEQFRALVENLPELAWSARADGHVDFYNQRWFEFTGTTLEQMQGWGWEKVHHPDHLRWVNELWDRSLQVGDAFEMEFPLRGADGTYRWFLTRVRPLKDSKGRILRWFGLSTDIDEKRRQEAQLQRAIDARDSFLSVASHELRTPLTPLILKLEVLEEVAAEDPTTPLAGQVIRHVEGMRRQLNRLAALVNTLLDVSRITDGRLSLELVELDYAAALREVVARFDLQARRAGCALTVDAPESLPGVGDRVRFEQIVTNLVDNALKYGAGKPIAVALRVEGDHAVLSVADRGIGIAREDVDRIFGRFERAVSDRNYGGLGLGLYITRTVVEALGGTVTVESVPGDGSTFVVKLPLRR